MAHLREKGKIPRTEWPNILARYGKGETIAQIGRDYGCTAPAIRYIIKRSGRFKPEREHAAAIDGGSRQQVVAGPRASGMLVRLPDIHPIVAPSESKASEHVLAADLRRRVTGDVASFLVALDQAVLAESLETILDLQDATDRLMRSAARTRLELERFLSAPKAAEPRKHRSRGIASRQASV